MRTKIDQVNINVNLHSPEPKDNNYKDSSLLRNDNFTPDKVSRSCKIHFLIFLININILSIYLSRILIKYLENHAKKDKKDASHS